MPDLLFSPDPFPPGTFAGVVQTRDLAGGRRLEVWPLTYGRARLQLVRTVVLYPGHAGCVEVLDEW